METKYSPSTIRKYGAFMLIAFVSVVLVVLLFLLALGIHSILVNVLDPLRWLGTFGIAMLTIVFLGLIWIPIWKRWYRGIVVQEQGVSIYGHELAWGDIKEVYTNPDEDYISILLSRPIERTTYRYIYKKDISTLDRFLKHIQEFGVTVKEETMTVEIWKG